MPQDISQATTQGDPQASELASGLGFITTLNQHARGVHASQQPVEPSQSQEMAQQGMMPQEDLTPRMDELEKQFIDLKTEVKNSIKDEMTQVKQMISDALTNEQD